jgi:hypothetical protein
VKRLIVGPSIPLDILPTPATLSPAPPPRSCCWSCDAESPDYEPPDAPAMGLVPGKMLAR